MNNISVSRIVFLTALILLSAFMVSAVAHASLVPCGKTCAQYECVDPPGAKPPDCKQFGNKCISSAAGDLDEAQPCTFCHLFLMSQRILNFMLAFVFIVVVGVIAYGGLLMMFSGGSPERIGKARQAIKKAFIGLVIVLLAWTILDFTIRALSNTQRPEGLQYPWYEVGKNIHCP